MNYQQRPIPVSEGLTASKDRLRKTLAEGRMRHVDRYIEYVETQKTAFCESPEGFLSLFQLTVDTLREGTFVSSARSATTEGRLASAEITTNAAEELTIRGFIDSLLQDKNIDTWFPDQSPEERKNNVEFAVHRILGCWLGMEKCFDKHGAARCRLVQTKMKSVATDETATRENVEALRVTLATLLDCPGLNPSARGLTPLMHSEDMQRHGDGAHLEALLLPSHNAIAARELNLYTLKRYADIKVKWTEDICQHLIVSREFGRDYLLLFNRPTVIFFPPPKNANLNFRVEVDWTYAALFRAYGPHACHRGLWSRLLGRSFWCLCKACSLRSIVRAARRKLNGSHTDPFLDDIINDDPDHPPHDWSPDRYTELWQRIQQLEQHMKTGKPRGCNVFRDRRNPKEFWNIMLVTLGFFLGFLAIVFAIIQTGIAIWGVRESVKQSA